MLKLVIVINELFREKIIAIKCIRYLVKIKTPVIVCLKQLILCWQIATQSFILPNKELKIITRIIMSAINHRT